METIGLLLLGLAIGVALGWLAARQRPVVQEPVVPVEDPALIRARHDAVIAELRQQEGNARSQVEADLAAAQATVEALRDTVLGLQGALESARDDQRILVRTHQSERQERERNEAGQTQVLKTLTPVAEQLRAMQRKVDELEKQRSHQHGELAEQLRTTRATAEESRKAADTLASALSNNATRGYWGETQLRTLVESAGLLHRVDFDTQASIQADSGARRPDMVVNLPAGKQMAIDAKAPYSAFVAAHQEGIAPDQRHNRMTEHAKKIRGHVDALSSKTYWTGLDASPEFTVAFIPNEQLLSAALEVDPSLLEYAFSKGVVLATPTNLWAVLKTVAFTWRQDVLTEDAKRLFDLGQELYRRVVTLAEHAEKLRRSLESTVGHYNRFASSLESRVLVTARKIDQMDESKLLPAPQMIEERPRPLISDDFAAIADLDRPEFEFDAVDAVLIDEDEHRPRAV